MIVFLDTGILGMLSSVNKEGDIAQCKEWLYGLLARGVYVISSVLCDYEARRSLALNNIRLQSIKSQASINNLDI